jgi:predicted RNA-binding protein YlqC (UPF0109 family)
MHEFLGEIQPLLLRMIRSLVDQPEAASVQVNQDAMPATLIVRVAPGDVGKIIGKQGRTARSIRVIVGASAQKFKHPSVAVDIGSNHRDA